MKYRSVDEIFSAFRDIRVMIIGDIMIDAYAWGHVNRISPEAPVPVVSVTGKEERLGGAGNVALNIKAMGAEPVLCSVIGNDEYGEKLCTLMKEAGLSDKGIFKSNNRQTTIKQRILSGSQQMLRIDEETDEPLSENEGSQFFDQILPQISECDVIIFQDYDKGVITMPLIEKIMGLTREEEIPVAVDPKKRNFLNYKDVALFKPNIKELREGLNIQVDKKNIEDIKKAIDKLNIQIGSDASMITLSEYGLYINAGTEDYHIPAHLREIADVSGAGDTVISVAALCLALNLPLKLMAGLSNLAGGLVCEHLGVAPVNPGDFRQEVEELGIINEFIEQPAR